MNDPNARHTLRRELRGQRNALNAPDQARAAEQLARRLTATRLFRTSRRIAVYLPNDGEIATHPVMTRLWAMGKDCYLPMLSRLRHDRLWFAPYLPDTGLAGNRFGIPEPQVPARLWVRAQDLDLILMPLVAFDPHGNRLGMGGGYYDKSLAFLRHRQVWRKPHLIGLAHDFQQVPRLEAFAWDIPLQGVVTDRRVLLF